MKKARIFMAAIILNLFIWPIMLTNASAMPNLPLPADYSILDTIEADVTGDGYADTVYLIGRKRQIDSLYTDNFSIKVKNGVDKTITTYALEKVGGYRTRLFAGDFSGDAISDVYIEVESGGSGGWSYHNIISFNSDSPKEIFGSRNNQSQSITGKFIDGLKAELINYANAKTIAIDVSERLQDYLRLGIYDAKGIVTKETQTMTAPFSKLDPIDYDKDGVFELKGIQRISGAYRADGLADVETVLKYKDAAWNLQSVKVTVFMDTAGSVVIRKPVLLPIPGITSSRCLAETDRAKVYYPQFANLDSFITMSVINAEIEKVVAEYSKQREYGSKTEIDYQITRQDKDIISVLFTGYQTWEGGKYDLMRSVNIDLSTRRVLNAKNLFKEDERTKKRITELLKKAAVNNSSVTHAPNFGNWMGIYFAGKNVVFFYMENDFAKEHVKLSVPLYQLQLDCQ